MEPEGGLRWAPHNHAEMYITSLIAGIRGITGTEFVPALDPVNPPLQLPATSMSQTLHPRRAAAASKALLCSAATHWDPSLAPSTSIQATINRLNREGFPFTVVSIADDLLVSALFGTKSGPRHYSFIHLTLTSLSDSSVSVILLPAEARAAAAICSRLMNSEEPVTTENVISSVVCLQTEVQPFHRSSDAQWTNVLQHLLFRYAIMYAESSSISLARVSFGSSASFGVKACRDICAGVFIMETCGTLNSNTVLMPGPSIIDRASKQLGPAGPCAILGPFRMVNHNCEPNSQIYVIARLYACIMVTLRNIIKGEQITVKYSENGYYGDACACETCTQHNSMEVRARQQPAETMSLSSTAAGHSRAVGRKSVSEGDMEEAAATRKRTRRGGVKRSRRKVRLLTTPAHGDTLW